MVLFHIDQSLSGRSLSTTTIIDNRLSVLQWNKSIHHPFVEAVSHICSPLTAALAIWSMQKYWQTTAIRAVVLSKWYRATYWYHSKYKFNTARNATTNSSSRSTVNSSLHTRNNAFTTNQYNHTSITNKRAYHYTCISRNPVHSAAPVVPPAAAIAAQTDVQTASNTSNAPTLYDSELMDRLSALYHTNDLADVLSHLHTLKSVQYVQAGLEYIHTWSGLPWWSVLVGVTVLTRISVMPINVSSMKNTLRIKVISPDIQQLQHQLNSNDSSYEDKVRLSRELEQLLRDNHCHPLKHWYVPILFPPVFLSYFAAIHNLCISDVDMAHQGTLWFTNLCAVDPTYILPVLSSITWLWCVELGGSTLYKSSAGIQNSCRMLSLASIPIASNLPSGIFMFWISANVYAVFGAYIFRIDRVRVLFGIPLQQHIQSLPHIPKPIPAAVWPQHNYTGTTLRTPSSSQSP